MRDFIDDWKWVLVVIWGSFLACAAPDPELTDGPGTAQATVTAPNGLLVNSLGPNGIMFNGIMFNGIMFNGIMFNGVALDGLDLGEATLDGLAPSAEQEAELQLILRYLVECALRSNQSVVMYASDGTAITYTGALGLAPAWQHHLLKPAEQHLVSACMAARSNALAQPVIISLRTPDMTVSQQEQDIFNTHEGAFWGNLFADQPYLNACVAQGGGLSGRVCAESERCGFTFMGDCANVCEFDESTGRYVSCKGGMAETDDDQAKGKSGREDGYEEIPYIVNTFLSLGHQARYGEHNICIIRQDGSSQHGTLSCWGDNDFGQLADGTTQASQSPFLVSALGSGTAEVAASSHVCARQVDGTMYCWGRNDHGQVGNGAQVAQYTPTYVTSNVAEVTVGKLHTCARKTDSSVWCWGNNQLGQVGIAGSMSAVTSPQRVTGVSAVRLSSSMSGSHTCSIDVNGALWCWGNNASGQLGDGTTTHRAAPVQVSTDSAGRGFASVTDVCTSQDLTCARKADGTAWCWGYSGSSPTSRPARLAFGGKPISAAPNGLSCGDRFACFVATDSTVWCLGSNQYDQLGYDTNGQASSTLHQVPDLDGVALVNAGSIYTCATRVDGSTWCWGTDPGLVTSHEAPLLFPDTTLSLTPVEVSIP